MLLELKVSQFAIIDSLHIQFRKGLNILSGETGAGKSVLLKSLSMLMGGKTAPDMIRAGAEQATIEGSFDLSTRQDLKERLESIGVNCEDDLLVVRRLVTVEKSRVYLNGTLSTLQTLREIVSPLIEVAGSSAPLIEMTGQHENRNLLSTHYHLDLLDQYAGTWEQRLQYQEHFREKSRLQSRIDELTRDAQNKEQRLDFLRFSRDEIQKLSPREDEEQFLEVELKKLRSSSRLTGFVDQTEMALYSDDDSAYSRLAAVLQKSNEMETIDPSFSGTFKALANAKSLIEDSVYQLRQYASKIEADPQKLEDLQARLSDLRKLQKKYGPGAPEILRHLLTLESEITILENSDSELEHLGAQLKSCEGKLGKIAKEMHKRRSSGAKLLADSVNDELADLNMKGVAFHVAVEDRKDLGPTGSDFVEFLSQTAPKEPPRPLAKFASGGELSRILLSLKRVVGATHFPRTYLFDEVDTGVSGPTAEKVGKKLRSIAKGQQVICITHLPQVASCGDAHFLIEKSPVRGTVQMVIRELEKKSRVEEIARLISGEKITKTSLAHAEQLMKGSL